MYSHHKYSVFRNRTKAGRGHVPPNQTFKTYSMYVLYLQHVCIVPLHASYTYCTPFLCEVLVKMHVLHDHEALVYSAWVSFCNFV